MSPIINASNYFRGKMIIQNVPLKTLKKTNEEITLGLEFAVSILTDLGMCAATETGSAADVFSVASGSRDSLPSDSSSSSSSRDDDFLGPQNAPR
jgi:hypothetical protein